MLAAAPGSSGWAEPGWLLGRWDPEDESARDPWAPSRGWQSSCLLSSPVAPELRGSMDRHRPRQHHPAAEAPYPSSASLRSCREGKMPRRKGPQHPPPSGGREEPGEKRPKFVSLAWWWGRAALSVHLGSIPGPSDQADSVGGFTGPMWGLHFVLDFQSCHSLHRFTTAGSNSIWIL